MNHTIRQQTTLRGKNDLLHACRDNAGFRAELLFFIAVVGLVSVLWGLA